MKPNASSVIEQSLKSQLEVVFNTKDRRQKKQAIETAGRLIDDLCEAIMAECAEQRAVATSQNLTGAVATDLNQKESQK